MAVVSRPSAACAASVILLIAGACNDPLSPVSAGSQPLSERVAALGRTNGAVTVPLEASFFTGLVSLAPDPSCVAPMLLNTQQGFGEATHLGRFSVLITFCIDPSELLDDGQLSPGESLPYENGFGALVGANGDELFITIAGAVLPSDHPDFDFEFADPFQIVGGTGRFDGAAGGGVTNSLVNFRSQPSHTEHHWSGTLVVRPGGM